MSFETTALNSAIALAERPLLTIAIPTYNRGPFLEELLDNLQKQLAGSDCVELLISDNASSDGTTSRVERFKQDGLKLRYERNIENIGSEANFVQCFNLATGKYLWVLGDDDLLLPHALARLVQILQDGQERGDYDLIHLSSISFSGPFVLPPQGRLKDKLGRFAEIITDGNYFLEKVNGLIGLISVSIVNKDRLLSSGYPALEALDGSNLSQLGWLFPLIHSRSRILYVWERMVAYRDLNSGGWNLIDVFGVQLHEIASKYFLKEPKLAHSLMNGVLRYWMCDSIMRARRGREPGKELGDSVEALAHIFRLNWRYWIFVYTVAELPLWAAKTTYGLLHFLNKLSRALQAVLRHIGSHGVYLFYDVRNKKFQYRA